MANTAPYVHEIKRLKAELSRLAKRAKELREQKRRAEERLRAYMTSNDLENVDGITLKSVTPKTRAKRKPKKQVERDAVETLRETGVENAEELWGTLKKIHIQQTKSEASDED